MERKELFLSGKNLEDLPLFFRRIYYNEITDSVEEQKLIKYNTIVQSDCIRKAYPGRQISKTINGKLIKDLKYEV